MKLTGMDRMHRIRIKDLKFQSSNLKSSSCPSCPSPLIVPRRNSVLPVDVDEARAARRDGVGVVGSRLPRDRAVRGYLDELELERLARGDAGVDDPVRVVGREHRAD